MLIKSQDTVYVVLQNPSDNFNYWSFIIGFLIVSIIAIFRKKLQSQLSFFQIDAIDFNISVFNIKGKLRYTTEEQEMAWKIYIELSTRVSLNKLDQKSGILRESLESLYQAFMCFRELLKNSSPKLFDNYKKDAFSINILLLKIMNEHLRPFLSKWHPLLEEYEKLISENETRIDHENKWKYNEEMRGDLEKLRLGLLESSKVLENIFMKKQ